MQHSSETPDSSETLRKTLPQSRRHTHPLQVIDFVRVRVLLQSFFFFKRMLVVEIVDQHVGGRIELLVAVAGRLGGLKVGTR